MVNPGVKAELARAQDMGQRSLWPLQDLNLRVQINPTSKAVHFLTPGGCSQHVSVLKHTQLSCSIRQF